MTVSTNVQPGGSGHAAHHRALAEQGNTLETALEGIPEAVEAIQNATSLNDGVISAVFAQPDSAARQTLEETVDARLGEVADPENVAEHLVAGRVDAEIAERGLVVGKNYSGSSATVAGFMGDNGRATDLVVSRDGSVPGDVLARWATRMVGDLKIAGVVAGGATGAPAGFAGGIAGENGRATDLVVTADGSVPDSVLLSRWFPRLAPLIAALIPTADTALDQYLDPARGMVVMRGITTGYTPMVSSSSRIAAFGDSLTDGWPKPPFASDRSDAWPGVFDSGWSGSVYNGGATGQSADEIAIRQGGYVISCDAFTIPAGVAQTAVPNSQLFGWRTDRGWSAPGTIAGIAGTLTRAGSNLSFVRSAAGAEVQVPAGTPFVSTVGEDQKNAIQVFFAGRNDIGYSSPAGAIVKRVLSAQIAMIERPGPRHKRFLTVGTTTSTSETAGTPNYVDVVAINNALARLYPDNYFDLRGYLVKQVIYDLGLTPTATDLNLMGADTLPPQIMANYNPSDGSHDGVHYSPATAAKVAAKLKTVMAAKGWLI